MATRNPRARRSDRRHSHSGRCHLRSARPPNRLSLFLPAAAQIPTAIIALGTKAADMLSHKGYVDELLQRPIETIELYLYFFILAYLIVFARRIREIEAAEHTAPK